MSTDLSAVRADGQNSESASEKCADGQGSDTRQGITWGQYLLEFENDDTYDQDSEFLVASEDDVMDDGDDGMDEESVDQELLSAIHNVPSGLERPCYWRMDPAESHGDFTIVVVREDTEAEKSYHIHKVFHTVGPFRSGYLASLISKEEGPFFLVESGELYYHEASRRRDRCIRGGAGLYLLAICKFDDGTKSTLGALHVADYMDVLAARWKCQALIDENINNENCHEYCT
jgi:hypothetical protein